MKTTSSLTSLVLTLAMACSASAEPPKQPHIVLIVADDLGYADVGFNGSQEIQTPNLDKLAEGGAVLKSLYAQPVCSPTRAALMTGRYPARTGVYFVVRPNAPWGLKLEERTMAQALRDAGYETALVGKWHLGEYQPAYRPTRRGFDHQYGQWFGMIDYFTHKRDGKLDWRRNDVTCRDEGYTTNLLAKEACRVIREKNPDKPLFLYLPFSAPHDPLQVPEDYIKPYSKLSEPRRLYAGMVSAMDEAVGDVLTALDEKGIRDNTLIVFFSDNGGHAPGRISSNGPLRAGKGTLFEGGVRVCACVNWPGQISAGKVIEESLHVIDWYPTLLRRGGASLEQELPIDGLDVWPVLTEGAQSPHEALLLCGLRRGPGAIRMGDWKLLVGAQGGDDSVLLYNLADDPGEQQNLADKQPAKVKQLRVRFDALMKTAVASGDTDR